MSRLPDLDPEKLTPEQRRVYDDIASGPRGSVRGPFLALLGSPQLADRVQKLGQYVRYDCAVPWKLREIAILVTAHHWRAQYEWFAHEKEARAAGVAESIIDSIRQGKRPEFDDPAEEEIYAFCTELYASRRVTERTFARVVDRHGQAAAVDLAGLLGHYNLIAITLTVFDVQVPGGEQPLAE
jgi:4-carboxymuconolactone decarboxylase